MKNLELFIDRKTKDSLDYKLVGWLDDGTVEKIEGRMYQHDRLLVQDAYVFTFDDLMNNYGRLIKLDHRRF